MEDNKKDSQYFSDITPLPVEEGKKKKNFSEYSVKAVILILLVLLLVLFKIIFK